jgi:hypothetical protein
MSASNTLPAVPGSGLDSQMGLHNLINEPIRLTREADRLNVELEALVMENYRVFVENLTCNVHLRYEYKKLGNISNDLGGNLGVLSQQCASFKDRVSHFITSHKRNRKTLNHHMQLLDLLEIPQLVDACARNGFHDEALELANFVNGLERRHLLASEVKLSNTASQIKSTNATTFRGTRVGSGVVQSIVDEVHNTLSGLRRQLLHQCTENTSLPKQIQTLSTLRKLDGLLIDRFISLQRHQNESAFITTAESAAISAASDKVLRQQMVQHSEVRLQMDFLEARTIWQDRHSDHDADGEGGGPLSSSAPPTSSSSLTASSFASSSLGPYGKAIEMLETKRTLWFAVITQFNALFLLSNAKDSSSSMVESASKGNAKPSAKAGSKSTHSSSETDHGSAVDTAAVVLNAWSTRQVQKLMDDLKTLLPMMEEGTSVRSVLEQSLFFAARMGQVGCDFTGLILPLFKQVILDRFHNDLGRVIRHFKSIILTEKISFSGEDATAGVGGGSYMEQVIPLFALQQQADPKTKPPSTADGASSFGTSNISDVTDELAAPLVLMRYPPLAYLLNCLLSSLNYIRECPLVTVKEEVGAALQAAFEELSAYLVDRSTDVRELGSKYFGDGYMRQTLNLFGAKGGDAGGSASSQGVSEEKMDKEYAMAMAHELFPHLLICLETIFNPNLTNFMAKIKKFKMQMAHARGSANSSTSSSSATAPSGGFLLSSAGEGKELLGLTLFARMEGAWAVMARGGLLPTASSAPPSAAPSAYTPSTATATATATAAAAANPSVTDTASATTVNASAS